MAALLTSIRQELLARVEASTPTVVAIQRFFGVSLEETSATVNGKTAAANGLRSRATAPAAVAHDTDQSAGVGQLPEPRIRFGTSLWARFWYVWFSLAAATGNETY